MKIQILGSGCSKCQKLFANAETVIQQNNLDCEIEKITDIESIVNMGVMVTPALAVNGKVISSGKVLSPDEIFRLIGPEASEKRVCSENEEPKPVDSTVCCCSSGDTCTFLKKILTVLLLIFVFGSVFYMLDRERNPIREAPEEQPAAEQPAGEQPAGEQPAAEDILKVYYFHGNRRCMTCNAIEELTRKVVGDSAGMQFITVNIEEPQNEHFIQDFQLVSRTVVMECNGKYEKFDRVWELVHSPEQFIAYIQDGIRRWSK